MWYVREAHLWKYTNLKQKYVASVSRQNTGI